MKKSFIITSMAALAALCFSLTAQAQGPVVVSDKDDYAPGEAAMFSAAGFQPNELLDFSVAVQDDQGLWVPDIAWADVPADASGGAEVDYIVPQTWADKTLQLTVMGLTSGLMATTTFTDAVPAFVVFDTVGLPVNTALGVFDGWRWNPAFFPLYRVFDSNGWGFLSPGPTNPALVGGCSPNMSFEFRGFPQTVEGDCAQESYVFAGFTQSPAAPPGATPFPTPHPGYAWGFTGDGGSTTTVTAHYNHIGSCASNSPPVITCLNQPADLGQAYGCLGTGTGFGQTFSVSYGVVNGSGNSKVVQATFTKALPGSGTVTVSVATVTDLDPGDTISVTPNGPSTVTISGPGIGNAPFGVAIAANDGHNPTVSDTCGGTATAQIIYNFNGFFPPLNNNATTKVKQGSTVPVKFQVTDCSGNVISTSNDTISVAFLSGNVPSGEPTVDDAGASNDNGTTFRWDPTGMQDIFNLKTGGTGVLVPYQVGDTYKITAHLDDGTTHDVSISIK